MFPKSVITTYPLSPPIPYNTRTKTSTQDFTKFFENVRHATSSPTGCRLDYVSLCIFVTSVLTDTR